MSTGEGKKKRHCLKPHTLYKSSLKKEYGLQSKTVKLVGKKQNLQDPGLDKEFMDLSTKA